MKALPAVLDELGSGYTQNKVMPIFEGNYNYVYRQIEQIRGLKPIKA